MTQLWNFQCKQDNQHHQEYTQQKKICSTRWIWVTTVIFSCFCSQFKIAIHYFEIFLLILKLNSQLLRQIIEFQYNAIFCWQSVNVSMRHVPYELKFWIFEIYCIFWIDANSNSPIPHDFFFFICKVIQIFIIGINFIELNEMNDSPLLLACIIKSFNIYGHEQRFIRWI